MWCGRLFVCLFFSGVVACGANAKSLLSAQPFPKTFNDLSFADRMDVLAEGYEPYESEYVAGPNGQMVCVKGCPYQGMSIEDHLDYIERTTQNAIADANAYMAQHATSTQSSTQNNIIIGQIDAYLEQNYANCISRHPDIPMGQTVPLGEPVIGKPRISSPYGERVHPIKHTQHVHDAIDYAIATGTYVYTTADGIVVSVWSDNDCGNGLKIKFTNGMYGIYCHLDRALVKKDDQVHAGCAVAISDNSGASTGPHLHYKLTNQHNKVINPSPFTGRAK